MIFAKKTLGQNFLQDKNIAQKIVSLSNPQKTDFFIEIGPGQGALTQFLLEKTDKLLTIEIDSRLVPELQNKFQTFQNFELQNIDFLEFDFTTLPQRVRIIGNLPYNITSQIIFKCFENRSKVSDLTIMVQREVADRLSASYGSKTYGILSVILSVYGNVKKLFNVPPAVFFPKPKVDSAVVSITFAENFELEFQQLFLKVVKSAFGQRRKMLSNSLSEFTKGFSSEILGNFANLRPEQLRPEDFVEIAKRILKSGKV
ncbi:ribosomal RNA small subunit methyltransferase A [bacterium]|nr:ribosomal RNA small subunit methyltransferase A [bacterium]